MQLFYFIEIFALLTDEGKFYRPIISINVGLNLYEFSRRNKNIISINKNIFSIKI